MTVEQQTCMVRLGKKILAEKYIFFKVKLANVFCMTLAGPKHENVYVQK